MAEPTTDDLLAFMHDHELRYWHSNEGTPEARSAFWERLKTEWNAIPDPADEQLRQIMGERDWGAYEQMPRVNSEGVRRFWIRKWKKDRKPRDHEPTVNELRPYMRPHERIIFDDPKKQPSIKKQIRQAAKQAWSRVHRPPHAPPLLPPKDASSNPSTQADNESYLVINKTAAGHHELRRHLELPSAEERALRKREELLKREERLQRQRESERRQEGLQNWGKQMGFTSAQETPKPYTQPKLVSKEEMAKLLHGESPDDSSDKKSTKQKFVAFIESPLFLAGVGVIVATLALVFWGALFVLAAAFFMGAIIRAYFFEHHRSYRLVGNIALCAIMAAVVFLFWYFVPNPFAKFQPDKQNQTQAQPTRESLLEISQIGFPYDTHFPLSPGQRFFITLLYKNVGAVTAAKVQTYASIEFVQMVNNTEDNKAVDELFDKIYRQIEVDHSKEGTIVLPNNSGQFSASKIPTTEQLKAFQDNKAGLVIAVRIEYDYTHYYEKCVIFTQETTMRQIQPNGESAAIECNTHNRLGVHPLNRLF